MFASSGCDLPMTSLGSVRDRLNVPRHPEHVPLLPVHVPQPESRLTTRQPVGSSTDDNGIRANYSNSKDLVMTAHRPALAGLHTSAARLPVEGRLPSFDGATQWLNSPPLTAASLRGKVTLVNFWTYTCINWLRQLPYLRAWAGKYPDHGLAVIGVHTPEFPFEHDLGNVRRAARDMRVDYPIAIDNDYKVWGSFANHYWPALYFADTEGRIRHHHYGEGEYRQSEMVIQQLLAEAGSASPDHELVSVDARGIEAPADWASLRSPEHYTGYERTGNFASPCGPVPGKPAHRG
jgi:thiol-disulfide isomerase/thioredoxin